jgi:spore coat polysaccharide biosynthesis protein SpsF (cytidylyltransferase family)
MLKRQLHQRMKRKVLVKISNNGKYAICIYRLRDVLRPLGKWRLEFINDVRKLYSTVRQQEYEAQGTRLPVGELLSLGEERILSKYLYKLAKCLQAPLRDNIHVFNITSSKSLKENIYNAFVQGKYRYVFQVLCV